MLTRLLWAAVLLGALGVVGALDGPEPAVRCGRVVAAGPYRAVVRYADGSEDDLPVNGTLRRGELFCTAAPEGAESEQ